MEGTRPARREDGDRCADLCREALSELQQARGGSLFVRRETGLIVTALLRPGGVDRLLADPRRRMLLGTVDESVVGLATGHLDAVGDTGLGIIDACYVEPGARGVGVGGALLNGLVGWFTTSGCRGVDISALPGDRDMKNLLEATGFKARLITMHAPHAGMTPARVAGAPASPVVAVGGVAVHAGALLLVQRGTDPQAGRWTIPGGRVEAGERLASAVEREMREETGLTVRCGPLLGWAERMGPGYHYVILDFTVAVDENAGTPRAGSDAAAVAWVPLEEVAAASLVDGVEEFLRSHGVIG